MKLTSGDQVYVTEGDQMHLRDRSSATLTFRGGSVTVLCAGSGVAVGPLWSEGDRRTVPHGELRLADGRVLVDTASTRSTFRPLELSVEAAGARLTNDGAAWYRVSAGGGSMVSTGTVRVDDQVQPVTDAALDCGDGREVQRPAGPTEEPSPSDEPSPTDLPSPTATPSVTPTPPAGTDDDGTDDDNPPPGQPGDNPVPPVTRPPTTHRRLPRRPRRRRHDPPVIGAGAT